MSRHILDTPRLSLRELTDDDLDGLCGILQDPLVMYAYEHAFSEEEVLAWLANQKRRYREEGTGLWAVILRETGCLIGQAGITLQDWNASRVPEIGYLFRRDAWHHGYATEAAVACREYAFHTLGLPAVYSIIRDNNAPSRHVAERNGMVRVGSLVKQYYGVVMPHDVYCVRRPD